MQSKYNSNRPALSMPAMPGYWKSPVNGTICWKTGEMEFKSRPGETEIQIF